MNSELAIIPIVVCAIFASSIVLTKVVVQKKRRKAVQERLESMIASKAAREEEVSLLASGKEASRPLLELPSEFTTGMDLSAMPSGNFYGSQNDSAIDKKNAVVRHLNKLYESSGLKIPKTELFAGAALLALLPPSACFLFDASIPLGLGLSILVLLASYIGLRQLAERRRNKFLTQLPNAIDLMISVLRSGHSIPQSVRSVGNESAEPLASEFNEIFQRMNLGQSLPEALRNTVERFESFELDLIRRASTIQLEVGGSLAELLEKTNETLRQRIKLKNQINVLTAQGRLSAWICGLLPLVAAIGFAQIDANYLKPLFENPLGQILLVTAIVLEIAGFLLMRKLSSFRI